MKTLICNATLINEGESFRGSLLISGERIESVIRGDHHPANGEGIARLIDARGSYLLPGAIDDQVHFREPGLTHKGDIASESRAAVAGGVTSYLEMPNTLPQTITRALLEEKFRRAGEVSAANYSFFMGATHDNLEELVQTDPSSVCGIKVFMGSSTGNMLVDDHRVLEAIFSHSPLLIALHCEEETLVRANLERAHRQYGEEVPIACHPEIRSAEACYRSTARAVELASRTGARIHVFHLSTARETGLFSPGPVAGKKITAEVCIHHLWFDDHDYATLGPLIRWNPAIKTAEDKEGLWKALLGNRIDVVATDHAPHTLEEKRRSYFRASSGGPMVQHSLVAMFEASLQGRITPAAIVEKMCHAPADLFRIRQRGYLRPGYFADLVILDPSKSWQVAPENLLYKCGWSPFDGLTFHHSVTHTFVNGQLAYHDGNIREEVRGQRLRFDLD